VSPGLLAGLRGEVREENDKAGKGKTERRGGKGK